MSCCCWNRRVAQNVYELEPLVPLPSQSEREEIGAEIFARPSDGRNLEYFVRNSGHQTAILNIVCTTCTGRLYHVWRTAQVLPLLEKYNVTLINVSAAGVGVSEPYGDWLGAMNVSEYLERTAQDMVALLRHLGIDQVFTMGISGGWTPAAVLAVKLASEPGLGLQLRGVCCISGIPWQTREENFWERSMGTGCTFALMTRLLESRMAPYMMNAMFPLDEEKFISSLDEETREALGPELSQEVAHDVNRANAYYLFVGAFLGRLTTNSQAKKLPLVLADLSKLGPEIAFHLHMSTTDKLVPTDRVVASISSVAPHVQNFPNALPHMAPPVDFAIAKLLETLE
ncbi:Hypothetical Protein FCC1311_063572 [Hondaea fermentalgiana]|uniref:AB hydrolase-1 domain-containing protein n=1 Tax=Hondaea fermentalgiana TaxID=2315210 RepID=A0A2R5GGX1_9STRA|nr:Hypothetical Protein FCC1311_063572 [Hondaea fermentalgiana]|eukprot:GBG30137.1 Hypothetical Protein FCC1311_063572 [Hondaea fermentalgiana]